MRVKAHRYKVYDVTIDDYRYSTRMATREHIARIGGVPIAGTEIELDDGLLSEGMTEKNFDPDQRIGELGLSATKQCMFVLNYADPSTPVARENCCQKDAVKQDASDRWYCTDHLAQRLTDRVAATNGDGLTFSF